MHEILLYGTVGSSFWDEEYFTAQTVREQLDGLSGPLTIRINSGGGIATEGQAIYTAIKNYPDTVTIVIDGIAASAASLIAMAGDEIVMPLGAIMMIHDPASWYVGGRGTEDDHTAAAKSLAVLANAYAAIYATRAGISKAQAREIMKAETYYDGPTALEAGFATSADDVDEASAPAAFDYRIYPKAPKTLRMASGVTPDRQRDQSVMATMVGTTPPKKGPKMAKDKITGAKPKAQVTTAVEGDEPDMDLEEETTAEVEDETTAVEEDEPEASESEDDPDADDEDEPVAVDGLEALAIIRMCNRRNLKGDVAEGFIARGLTCAQATAELNKKGKDVTKISRAPTARILRDERETRRVAMSTAIAAQIGGTSEVPVIARPFMDMSLVEMAAVCIGHTGPVRTAGQRMQVFMNAAASHTTSDFPSIFQNALNKSLLDRYTIAAPTYREVSKKKNFRDFRPMPLIRTGDFPTLQPVGEGGEIKWGTFGASGETAVLQSYAVGLTVSRQMLINDDIGAIDELLSNYGDSVAMFEERAFYQYALKALLSDGKNIFHADHKNLAAAGSDITTESVSKARAAMRKHKSDGGQNLNITPSILLVGPDMETQAEMFVAAITATSASDVNPFSGKLRVIVTPEIDDTSWYLLSGANPVWTHGFLEGGEAPRLRTEEPFGTQGFAMTLEHDFGVGAVDYRGGFKSPKKA